MKRLRIVVGTNFTECADMAARFAFQFFSSNNLDVELAFCLSQFIDVTDLTDELRKLPEDGFRLQQGYVNKLTELQQRYRPLIGNESQIQCSLLHGYPEEALNEFANACGADLLVVGDSMATNSFLQHLGSKTADIIQKASLPILTVPLATPFIPSEINGVLYMTDFRDTEFESLHKLIEWLPKLGTRIYCVHYCHEKPDKWDEHRLVELQAYCATTYRNHQVVCKMMHGDNWEDELLHFIQSNSIQLVSMTHKHRRKVSTWFHRQMNVAKLPRASFPFLLFSD